MAATLGGLGRLLGWGIVILAVAGLVWAVGAERWSDRWGATDEEVSEPLPGDALIAAPAMTTTRAVTVRVPPEQVWPWIAQFGQGRGGLYSYDWLERLFGIDMRSADTVLADQQEVAVGDQLWVTQPGYPADLGMVVADVQPGAVLVLAMSTPARTFAPDASPWTWSFVLQPSGDGGTRLIVRNRNASVGGVGDVIWDRVVGPIGFAMERRTMLGIAQRAEAAAGLDTGWAWRETLWFAGLLHIGLSLAVIALTRTPPARKLGYLVGLTAAATLVLFRVPWATLSVALAAFSVLVAVLLWRAWPPSSAAPPGSEAPARRRSERELVGAGR